MAIYSIPGAVETIEDLAVLQQSTIADCSGVDGTSGWNTAVNSLIDVFQAYGQVA